jgi:hypothetical protein
LQEQWFLYFTRCASFRNEQNQRSDYHLPGVLPLNQAVFCPNNMQLHQMTAAQQHGIGQA